VTDKYAKQGNISQNGRGYPVSVQVKFMQSGTFHAGEIKSLDLEKISRFQITHQRNSCELFVTTPENPRPETPYMLARRDREYELQAIVNDLRQLKLEQKEAVYNITDTEAGLVTN
jgi:hypothetical protein